MIPPLLILFMIAGAFGISLLVWVWWKNWSRKERIFVVSSLVAASIVGILLGSFLSKRLLLDTDVSNPVLKEYKSATEDYVRLREDLNKAIELYDSGKGNFAPLLEADNNLEASEEPLEAAGKNLQIAIQKNSKPHFQLAMQFIQKARNYMKIAEEKIQEFYKSAQ